MKKIFLMISAAVGGLLPFSRADAACTTSYRYSDGSTSSSYNFSKTVITEGDDHHEYTKIEDCGDTKTETFYYEINDDAKTTKTTYTLDDEGVFVPQRAEITDSRNKGSVINKWTEEYSCSGNYCETYRKTVTEPNYMSYTCTRYFRGEYEHYCHKDRTSLNGSDGIIGFSENEYGGYDAYGVSSSKCNGGSFKVTPSQNDCTVRFKCNNSNYTWYSADDCDLWSLLDTDYGTPYNSFTSDVCNGNTYKEGGSCKSCPTGMASCHLSNGEVVMDSCIKKAYNDNGQCRACKGTADSCDLETRESQCGDYRGKLKSVCDSTNFFYLDDNNNLIGGYADGTCYTCSNGICSSEGKTINALQCPAYRSPTSPLDGCAEGFDGKCFTCQDYYYKKGDTCVESCGNGFYVSGKICKQNPEGCKSMNSSGKCGQCEDGFFFSNYNYYRYKSSYYSDQCVAMPEGCIEISTSYSNYGKCTSCQEGLKLDSGNYTCQTLPENCTSIYDGKCSSCKEGYYKDEDNVCQSCPEGMERCYFNTSGDFAGSLKTSTSCEGDSHYYTDKEGNLIGGYEDSFSCGNPKGGCYYTCNNGVCKGTDGTIINDFSCTPVKPLKTLPANCAEGSNDVCSKCDSNYFLKDGACVSDCGDGQYGENGACKALPENCTAAANGACTTCADSHFLKDGACVSDCGEGQYGENGICNDLPANCKSYSYGCTDCAEGYYLRAGNCDPLPANCSAAADGKCTTCSDGYLEKAGSCVTECGEGYKENFGVCNKVRWTPPEAAAATSDDNTNVVTIMFKK